MKSIIYKIFSYLGINIMKKNSYLELMDNFNFIKEKNHQLEFILNNPRIKDINKSYDLLRYSESQISQDLFVLNELNFKKNGFFVEIGAGNGKHLSNTYMLEKIFNWNGILCEPAKIWKQDISKNRSCIISDVFISNSDEMIIHFIETKNPLYSTRKDLIDFDNHAGERRTNFKSYNVKTLTLEKLLEIHNAPLKIDYLSIDTEGSEYDIIKNFNFSKYQINILTIEHNNNLNKDLIDELMNKNNYKKVLEKFSQYESWFIKI